MEADTCLGSCDGDHWRRWRTWHSAGMVNGMSSARWETRACRQAATYLTPAGSSTSPPGDTATAAMVGRPGQGAAAGQYRI